jgi:hypothetical protein
MVRLMKYLGRDPKEIDTKKYTMEGTNKVDWRSFADAWKDLKMQVDLGAGERIYLGFDPSGAASCGVGKVVSTVVFITIILSSISFILSTLQGDLWQMQECQGCKPKPRPIFGTIEDICAVVFTTEFLVRLLFCMTVRLELLNEEDLVEELCSDEPVRWLSPLGRMKKFWSEKSNIIDFLAIVPYYFEKLVDTKTNLMVLRLVRLTRMFRILRLGKLSDAMDTLVDTFNASLPSLYVLSFYICLGILVSSSIVYYVEAGMWDEENQYYVVEDPLTGEKIETLFVSIPDTFWWTIVTVTTVGYGDLYPNTALGKLFGSITIVAGVIAFAMPVGVISSNFSHVWDKAQAEKAKSHFTGLSLAAAEAKTIEDGFEHVGLKRSELKFQVFHIEPPAENLFIGCAILDISRIKWDVTKKTGAAVTLQLESDPDRSKKSVSGSLIVNLLWEPEEDGKLRNFHDKKELHQHIRNEGQLPNTGTSAQKKTTQQAFNQVVNNFWERPATPLLKGNLTIEIVSATGLSATNPRVEVEVYPGLRPGVPPEQWVTMPQQSANPVFNLEIRSFALDWTMNSPHRSIEPTAKDGRNIRRSQMSPVEVPSGSHGWESHAVPVEEEDEDLTPLDALLPPSTARTMAERIIEELQREVKYLQQEKSSQEESDKINGQSSSS